LRVEVTQLITELGGKSDNYKENIWEIAFHFILAYLATTKIGTYNNNNNNNPNLVCVINYYKYQVC
jgi:hypothetical protein